MQQQVQDQKQIDAADQLSRLDSPFLADLFKSAINSLSDDFQLSVARSAAKVLKDRGIDVSNL
jgi:hypothetical protein